MYIRGAPPFSFRLLAFTLLASFTFIFLPALAITGVTPSGDSSSWSQMPSGTSMSAGRVYHADIVVSEQTYRWAALWGNVSGSMVLRDGNSNQFVEWNILDVQNGSVLYATTFSGVLDPGNLSSTNGTFLGLADGAYGFNKNVTDSVTHTFTGTATFQSPSMDTNITVNSTIISMVWTNYMLRRTPEWPDGQYPSSQDDFVWAVEIRNDQPSFAGGTADYQIILPENEEVGQHRGQLTTYYFWLEFE